MGQLVPIACSEKCPEKMRGNFARVPQVVGARAGHMVRIRRSSGLGGSQGRECVSTRSTAKGLLTLRIGGRCWGIYLRTSSRQNKEGTTMPVPVDRVKPVLSSSTFPVGRRRVMLAAFGRSEDHLPTVCGLRGSGRRCVRRCAEKRHPPHPRRSLSDRKAGSEVDRAARLSVVIRGQDMRRGQDRRLRGRWRGRCAEDRGRGLPRQARLGSPPISGG